MESKKFHSYLNAAEVVGMKRERILTFLQSYSVGDNSYYMADISLLDK